MDLQNAVTHPSHYLQQLDPATAAVRDALVHTMDYDIDVTNLECFVAMISTLSVAEMRGYLRGNSFKYRWRYQKKAGVQDLKKAQWYEQRLLVLEQTIVDFANDTKTDL